MYIYIMHSTIFDNIKTKSNNIKENNKDREFWRTIIYFIIHQKY